MYIKPDGQEKPKPEKKEKQLSTKKGQWKKPVFSHFGKAEIEGKIVTASELMSKPKPKNKIAYGSKQIKELSITIVKRDLDTLTSLYIRMSAANDEGYAQCVSCGKIALWHTLQNGHFIKRTIAPNLIFNLMNLGCQCYHCNMRSEGNIVGYYGYMIKKHGQQKVEWLQSMIGKKSMLGLFDYKAMCVDLAVKVKIEAKRLGHEFKYGQIKIINRWS